jgi:hypothetical protein
MQYYVETYLNNLGIFMIINVYIYIQNYFWWKLFLNGSNFKKYMDFQVNNILKTAAIKIIS